MSINKGKVREQEAKKFLLDQGLKLISSNFYSRWGEIDLIMQHHSELVFIEVRERNHTQYGDAIESINKAKQNRIIKTSKHFLSENKRFQNSACRYDVIAYSPSNKHDIQWVQDAFCLDSGFSIL